jgi:hypothetical protein
MKKPTKNKENTIAYFKSIIPQRINVQLIRSDDEKSICVQVLNLPHCYTQVRNTNELPEMLTDLVLTHFEVPKEFRDQLGSYIPISNKHLRLEEAFRRLIEIGAKTCAGKEVNETFERAEAMAV